MKARRTHQLVALFAILSAILSAPHLAVAQTYDPATVGAPASASGTTTPSDMMRDPTIHRHFGFFFRPELGFGYSSSTASSGGTDLTIKGGGASLALAFGGAVTENFIVGGQLWDVIASSPTVERSDGSSTASTGTSDDASAGVVGYGLLLNWYFPSNVYVALTPSLTRLVADDGSNSGATQWGFGARAAIGKEWWVSNHWGIGAAAAIALSSNEDSSDAGAPTWKTLAFSLGLSATFN